MHPLEGTLEAVAEVRVHEATMEMVEQQLEVVDILWQGVEVWELGFPPPAGLSVEEGTHEEDLGTTPVITVGLGKEERVALMDEVL